MEITKITFKMTLELDEKWVRNYNSGELIDYIKERLNSSLGFRGAVKKLTVVNNHKKQKMQ